MARAMTERKWLACTDPNPMLAFLRNKGHDRALWLFTVACFNRVWLLIPDRVKEAMAVTERFAEGRATVAEMGEYNSTVSAFGCAEHAVGFCRARAAEHAREQRRKRRARSGKQPDPPPTGPTEIEAQVLLLREVVGNPFRRVTLDPAWLTSTVVTLARTMYESQEFGAMPILADALQDAGCDDADILDHCRADGWSHVRGCWVLDLLLGKRAGRKPSRKSGRNR